jgi:hypothetical protein
VRSREREIEKATCSQGERYRRWDNQPASGERKGEDTMKLTLAAIVGMLMFVICVIASSTPLQLIEQRFELLAR